MRSNDVVKGFAYDGPWFISLMYKMVDYVAPSLLDLLGWLGVED